MKILVAVDGSAYTKRMLAYLAAHEEWLGDRHQYTLLHVVLPVPLRASHMVDKATLASYYAEHSDKVFKPLRTFFDRQGLKASFVGKVGVVADVVADVATKGRYDLLVMGSHGHSSLANLVMGSVATKVLAHCKTPVLLVR